MRIVLHSPYVLSVDCDGTGLSSNCDAAVRTRSAPPPARSCTPQQLPRASRNRRRLNCSGSSFLLWFTEPALVSAPAIRKLAGDGESSVSDLCLCFAVGLIPDATAVAESGRESSGLRAHSAIVHGFVLRVYRSNLACSWLTSQLDVAMLS